MSESDLFIYIYLFLFCTGAFDHTVALLSRAAAGGALGSSHIGQQVETKSGAVLNPGASMFGVFVFH